MPESEKSYSDVFIQLEVPMLSAAVVLEWLLSEEHDDDSLDELFSRRWHRKNVIEAFIEAFGGADG
jgi:hypothetical protein